MMRDPDQMNNLMNMVNNNPNMARRGGAPGGEQPDLGNLMNMMNQAQRGNANVRDGSDDKDEVDPIRAEIFAKVATMLKVPKLRKLSNIPEVTLHVRNRRQCVRSEWIDHLPVPGWIAFTFVSAFEYVFSICLWLDLLRDFRFVYEFSNCRCMLVSGSNQGSRVV